MQLQTHIENVCKFEVAVFENVTQREPVACRIILILDICSTLLKRSHFNPFPSKTGLVYFNRFERILTFQSFAKCYGC